MKKQKSVILGKKKLKINMLKTSNIVKLEIIAITQIIMALYIAYT